MSDSPLTIPAVVQIAGLPLEALRGAPGNATLVPGFFLPTLTLNGVDIALGYKSRIGTTRWLRGVGCGLMTYTGNMQFDGLIPCSQAEVEKPTALIFALPAPIAVACGVETIGEIGYRSNLWPPDQNHPKKPAVFFRGGGGNAWAFIDGMPEDGNTNPTQLGLRDLNLHTQLDFLITYPTD